jgi:GT2 family glycosyltransferase
VKYLNEHPDTDLVYSDEDKIMLDGAPGDPAFKPDWSPDYLRSTNYICHFACLRTSVVRDVGGFRSGYDGSQDHDLILRVGEVARNVGHLPKVLYVWRQVPGSAAIGAHAKPRAHDAGRRAVEDSLQRTGEEGTVEDGPYPGLYHVRYKITGTPSVAIVIPACGGRRQLASLIGSLQQWEKDWRLNIVIVDSESGAQVGELPEFSDCKVIPRAGHFAYSAMLNAAVAGTDADYGLFLHSDTEWAKSGVIAKLLEQSQRKRVGAASCTVLGAGGGAQSLGMWVGGSDLVAPAQARWPVARDVAAVDSCCFMVKLDFVRELGGFDEEFLSPLAVADFCLRAEQAGRFSVHTPLASVKHIGDVDSIYAASDWERDLFSKRWLQNAHPDHFESPHVLRWQPLTLKRPKN